MRDRGVGLGTEERREERELRVDCVRTSSVPRPVAACGPCFVHLLVGVQRAPCARACPSRCPRMRWGGARGILGDLLPSPSPSPCWRAAERRHPTGRERMGSPTLQTFQDPILLLLGCFFSHFAMLHSTLNST
jgi:ferredoxin